LLLVFASCASPKGVPDAAGDSSTTEALTTIDARQKADSFEAVADTPRQADDISAAPDPTLVFERRTRSSCEPDGPHEVDRVTLVRTMDLLPDLDVQAVLAQPDRVLAGGPSGLWVSKLLASAVPSEAVEVGPFAPVELYFDDCRVRSLADRTDGGVVVACTLSDGAFSAFLLDANLETAGGVTMDQCDEASPGEAGAFECDGLLWTLCGGELDVQSDFEVKAQQQVLSAACVADEPWLLRSTGARRLVGGPWKGEWLSVCGEEECGGLEHLAGFDGGAWAAGGDRLVRLVTDGIETEVPVGAGGLPADQVTALAASPDGDGLAAGHSIGVSLARPETTGFSHFHSLRWLPAEEVSSVSLADGTLWAATPAGLAAIATGDILLQDKADRMFQALDQWFWRLDGFLTADARFDDPWTDTTSELWDNDNDGQWTEEGLAAFCYAWSVTGEEGYLEAARKAAHNMLLLIDIPAVSFVEKGMAPGFVSRSVVRDDEGDVFASKATQPNWHLVHWTDGHDYYWKDDTSSDETTGHFFGLSLYYDLCADAEERTRVAERLDLLAGYILDNGFLLIDLDGLPTEHGNWTSERLTMALDGPENCIAAGHTLVECMDSWGGGAFLDSVEILSYMAAAWHVTGNERYLEALEELSGPLRVGEAAMFNENVMTWTERGLANYCDHELADLAFLTLLRYDPDEGRRSLWLQSMMAAWEFEIGERNPLKSLAIAATMDEVPGLSAGITTLVAYPEDLRRWRVDNSHRKDAEIDAPDRHGQPQFKTVLPHDEIPVQRWDSNPYQIAGGSDGTERMNPAFWLLPYWGLRYHGAICGE